MTVIFEEVVTEVVSPPDEAQAPPDDGQAATPAPEARQHRWQRAHDHYRRRRARLEAD